MLSSNVPCFTLSDRTTEIRHLVWDTDECGMEALRMNLL